MSQKERKLERIVKGFANHRRIEMLRLLQKRPELAVHEVAAALRINLKTASEHLRRLHLSGLVHKKYRGHEVKHSLTSRAKLILPFLVRLDHS